MAKARPRLAVDPLHEPVQLLSAEPYEFMEVNGFVYRCNKITGEMWRLEAHATDRKAQVWKKVEDAGSVQ